MGRTYWLHTARTLFDRLMRMVVRLLGALRELDCFIRYHQLGFVAIWPLLGWACVAPWSPAPIAALVVIALFFNTFGVVHNDVIHLRIDRRDPLKAEHWLVRGILTSRLALIVAIAQVPAMIGVHFAASFPIGALPSLMGVVAGQGVYNLYGKRCPVPPAMEAFEAASAFLLVVYGASVTGSALNSLVWLTASAGAVFILLVNAFHGCLRDIDVEISCNQQTTPRWFGCHGVGGGVVHISKRMSLYGGTWQLTLLALSLYAAAQIAPDDRSVQISVGTASLANVLLFIALHRVKKPAWDVVMRVHVGVLMLPIMLAFVPRLGPQHSVVLFVLYVGPTLLTLDWWHRHAHSHALTTQAAHL